MASAWRPRCFLLTLLALQARPALAAGYFSDDFNSNAINPPWTAFTDPGAPAAVVQNGQLQLGSGAANTYAGLMTPTQFNFTDSAVIVEVVNAGNQSLANWALFMEVGVVDSVDEIQVLVNQNFVTGQVVNGGAVTNTVSRAFSASTPWLRVREIQSTLEFSMSADGTNWNLFGTTTLPFAASSAYFSLFARGDGTATTGVLDNFRFVPNGAVPTVVTQSPTNVGAASATLQASANPNGGVTTGWFRYDTVSPGSCNDTFGTRSPAAGGVNLGNGNSAAAFASALSGLKDGTLYYVCALASNSAGVGMGNLLTFSHGAVPPPAPVPPSGPPSGPPPGSTATANPADLRVGCSCQSQPGGSAEWGLGLLCLVGAFARAGRCRAASRSTRARA